MIPCTLVIARTERHIRPNGDFTDGPSRPSPGERCTLPCVAVGAWIILRQRRLQIREVVLVADNDEVTLRCEEIVGVDAEERT